DMMLAMRLEPNVTQQDHFVIAADLLECTLQIIAWIFVIAGEPFFVRFRHSLGRSSQPLTVGIIADPSDQRANRVLGFRLRWRLFFSRPGQSVFDRADELAGLSHENSR